MMLLKPMPLEEAKEFYERLKEESKRSKDSILGILMDDIWFFTEGLQKDYGGKDNMKNNAVFSKYKQLAIDIYEFCKKHDLWGDNTIYFDGKAWSSSETWGSEKGKKIAEDLYEYEDRNPRDYFGGGDSLLSCSCEGSLNHLLNNYTYRSAKLAVQFYELFEKYGLYFEMYNSWNGNAYEF